MRALDKRQVTEIAAMSVINESQAGVAGPSSSHARHQYGHNNVMLARLR
jgi:hypothetical protein